MINQINNLQGYSITPASNQPAIHESGDPGLFFQPELAESVHLSLDAKSLQKIEEIEKQLDEIFGVPKPLTEEQKKQEEAIFNEIDKILGQSSERALSKQDQEKADKIFAQLDKLYSSESLTSEQQKQVSALEKQLDDIFSGYQTNELSKENNKKLENLFTQLDKLYGFKTPTEEQLNQADKLFAELETLFSAGNDKSLTYEGLAKR